MPSRRTVATRLAIAEAADANCDSGFFLRNAGDLASQAGQFKTAAVCYDRLIEVKPDAVHGLRTNKVAQKAYKKAGRPLP